MKEEPKLFDDTSITFLIRHYTGPEETQELALKEYTRLRAIEKLAGEMVEHGDITHRCKWNDSRTGFIIDGWYCPHCSSKYNDDIQFCTNPTCPAVELRGLLEVE